MKLYHSKEVSYMVAAHLIQGSSEGRFTISPFRRKPFALAAALFLGLTLLQAFTAFVTTRYGGAANFWLVLPRGIILNAALGFISALFISTADKKLG